MGARLDGIPEPMGFSGRSLDVYPFDGDPHHPGSKETTTFRGRNRAFVRSWGGDHPCGARRIIEHLLPFTSFRSLLYAGLPPAAGPAILQRKFLQDMNLYNKIRPINFSANLED